MESWKIILILFCIMASLGCSMAESLNVEWSTNFHMPSMNKSEVGDLHGFKYGPRSGNASQVKKDEHKPYRSSSPIAISPEGESYFISRKDHEDHKDKHHKHKHHKNKHKQDCGASTTVVTLNPCCFTSTMLGVLSILVTFLWFP